MQFMMRSACALLNCPSHLSASFVRCNSEQHRRGKTDGNGRACTRATADLDRSSLSLDEFSGNCQAQTASPSMLRRTATRWIGAVKTIEDVRQYVGCNALASIADCQYESILGIFPRSNLYPALWRGKLHGIIDQV